jgi:hypothetical protein
MGAFVVVPIIVFFVAIIARGIAVSVPLLLGFAAVFALADLVFFRIVVRRFRREEILTRWR